MEPIEAAEKLREIDEETSGKKEEESDERFRNIVAIIIAVMAMLLAITSLGGQRAMKEMLNANIRASDTWAFYQAKNIRQADYQLAVDSFEYELIQPDISQDARDHVQKRLEEYKKNIERYESDPQSGEGKEQLKEKAAEFEKERDRAKADDPNFEFSEAIFEIAIVLSTVAILTLSRKILGLALVLAVLALVLMLNGFLIHIALPV